MPYINASLNVSDTVQHFFPVYAQSSLVPMLFLGVVVCLSTVIGNLLVVVVIFGNYVRSTAHHRLLLSLAIADGLVGLVVMPFKISHRYTGVWMFGNVGCSCWLALEKLLFSSSVFSLCAIALDRLWAVTCPHYSHRQLSRSTVAIASVWIAGTALAVSPLVGTHPWNGALRLCAHDSISNWLFIVLTLFVLPLIIMTACYVRVLVVFVRCQRRTEQIIKHGMKRRNRSCGFPVEADHGSCNSMHSSRERSQEFSMHSTDNGSRVEGSLKKSIDAPGMFSSKELSTEEQSGLDLADMVPSAASPAIGNSFSAPSSSSTFISTAAVCRTLGDVCLPPSIEVGVMRGKTGSSDDRRRPLSQNNLSVLLDRHSSDSERTSMQNGNTLTKVDQEKRTGGYEFPTEDLKLTWSSASFRLFVTSVVVLGTFVVCVSPYMFLLFIKSVCSSCSASFIQLKFPLDWLILLNCSLNPFIYAFFNLDIRKGLHNLAVDLFRFFRRFRV